MTFEFPATTQLLHSVVLANGFLPTRGSWMLDFVTVAMLAVSLVLCCSIFLVRVRKNRRLHRLIQIVTAVVLALALIAFEIDVRFLTDWRALAAPSPYYESGWVQRILWIHLMFAIPTPLVWGALLIVSLKRFRSSFEQGSFNQFHRRGGWLAALLMFMTAITGWIFYYVAFVA